MSNDRTNDHDLLIEIKTDVKNFIKLIDAHDKRIGFLEKTVWAGLGGLGLLQIIIGFLK